jgi:DNA polymerase epsilon subunit 1
VGQDIASFEYTPKPEFEGPFIVFNEENELKLLQRFLDHMKQARMETT